MKPLTRLYAARAQTPARAHTLPALCSRSHASRTRCARRRHPRTRCPRSAMVHDPGQQVAALSDCQSCQRTLRAIVLIQRVSRSAFCVSFCLIRFERGPFSVARGPFWRPHRHKLLFAQYIFMSTLRLTRCLSVCLLRPPQPAVVAKVGSGFRVQGFGFGGLGFRV